MAQSKIVKHGLEDVVLKARREQRTIAEMTKRCNTVLARRKVKDKLSEKVVERWLTSIDKASLAVAIAPEVVEEAVAGALDVMANLRLLDGTLKTWLDDVATAAKPVKGVFYDSRTRDLVPVPGRDDHDERGHLVDVYEIDWQARVAVAKEMRQHAEAIANILERVYNTTQVEAFQAAMSEAIAEADPETAQRLVVKLREKQSVVRAQLLGAPA